MGKCFSRDEQYRDRLNGLGGGNRNAPARDDRESDPQWMGSEPTEPYTGPDPMRRHAETFVLKLPLQLPQPKPNDSTAPASDAFTAAAAAATSSLEASRVFRFRCRMCAYDYPVIVEAHPQHTVWTLKTALLSNAGFPPIAGLNASCVRLHNMPAPPAGTAPGTEVPSGDDGSGAINCCALSDCHIRSGAFVMFAVKFPVGPTASAS